MPLVQDSHLLCLADLLGPDGLQRRTQVPPTIKGFSLQARVSEAFRIQFIGCFLAEAGEGRDEARSAA